jgi:hypothetical protein
MLTATLADCPCKQWTFTGMPAISTVGWHGVPTKCPKCTRHYVIMINVSVRILQLHVEVTHVLRLLQPSAAAMRRALLSVPSRPWPDETVEFVTAVTRLLEQRGGARSDTTAEVA